MNRIIRIFALVILFCNTAFSAEMEYEVISSYGVPGSHPMGLAFDGELFWTYDVAHKKIIGFRPSDGGVVVAHEYKTPFGIGVAYDGSALRIVDVKNKTVSFIDPLSGEALESHVLDMSLPTGIQCGDGFVWVCDSKGEGSISAFSENMGYLYTIPAPGRNPFGIAVDEKCLWVSDNKTPVSSESATINCVDPMNGKVLGYFTFKEGFRAPTGLEVVDGFLYVLSNSTKHVYQLKVKKLPPRGS